MNIQRFLEKNEQTLTEFEAETFYQQKLSRKASLTQIMSFDYMYRKVLAIYAAARHNFPNTQGTQKIAEVVSQSHSIIYKDTIRKENFKKILSYRLFRSVYEVKSVLIFTVLVEVLGLVAGILWGTLDAGNATSFAHSQGLNLGSFQGRFYGTSIGLRTVVATEIFTHNIQVSVIVFLGGFLLGIPTVYFLFTNTVLLGVLGALEFKSGGGSSFIRLIVPHGVLEMSCITVAGIAGMRVAKALLVPGQFKRSYEMTQIMGPVIDALGLCSITLVFSGLVEAIVTSYYLNVVVALSVGILLGATFWSLIIIQGRKVEINI